MEVFPVSQSITAALNCFYNIGNTSTETACINCVIINDFDGTCVAITHLKTSLLVNSSHGLKEINVNFLNRSLDSSLCTGCIDGISINDYDIAVFTYQDHVGIFGPHAIVRQQRLSDYTSGNLRFIKLGFKNSCDIIPYKHRRVYLAYTTINILYYPTHQYKHVYTTLFTTLYRYGHVLSRFAICSYM